VSRDNGEDIAGTCGDGGNGGGGRKRKCGADDRAGNGDGDEIDQSRGVDGVCGPLRAKQTGCGPTGRVS
jgi:hypothetical protein